MTLTSAEKLVMAPEGGDESGSFSAVLLKNLRGQTQ